MSRNEVCFMNERMQETERRDAGISLCIFVCVYYSGFTTYPTRRIPKLRFLVKCYIFLWGYCAM